MLSDLQSNKVSKFFPSLFDAYVIRSKAVEQNHHVVVFLLFFSNVESFVYPLGETNKTRSHKDHLCRLTSRNLPPTRHGGRAHD